MKFCKIHRGELAVLEQSATQVEGDVPIDALIGYKSHSTSWFDQLSSKRLPSKRPNSFTSFRVSCDMVANSSLRTCPSRRSKSAGVFAKSKVCSAGEPASRFAQHSRSTSVAAAVLRCAVLDPHLSMAAENFLVSQAHAWAP